MDARPAIDLADDDFGCILNGAVRYALGRQTYMPSTVTGFIKPLIPYINTRTLLCFDQDIADQERYGGYGDPKIDEPVWHDFHSAVRTELQKRGEGLYKLPWSKE